MTLTTVSGILFEMCSAGYSGAHSRVFRSMSHLLGRLPRCLNRCSREALANELAALCERIDKEFQATREDAGQQSEAAQFASRAGTIRTSSCLSLEVPVGL